ncbi:TPA: CRISPR system precrRNA processing endoribonuclease RAMP protein Cas6 [Candidatus Poribacteria bacterium]|nr:CRISPR system precrRNA processing endoribonuclease RAMP protein Cas6 [Candidatus Poribacteria bacterium]
MYLGRYRFTLIAQDEINLPPFIGSILRGGFGYSLKRLVCIIKRRGCSGCILEEKCAYRLIFETSPTVETPKFMGISQLPRPFVLKIPFDPKARRTRIGRGEAFTFQLILIGRAIDLLPHIIVSLSRLARMGLGRDKGRAVLHSVHAVGLGEERLVYDGMRERLFDPPEPISSDRIVSSFSLPDPHRVTINYLTPTRIKVRGDLVFPIRFHHLIKSLLHRISMLSYLHCGQIPDLDYVGLMRAAEKVEMIGEGQRWLELSRYSSRQRTKMFVGGAIGRTSYRSDEDLSDFCPLLALGEWINAGKLTTMGLGSFEVIR